ncbi:MAG: DUF1585 domain-containing protein [Deltaproteobacteria bacterium]|nr:DUF1585 domain-containing protein [Nannocystaceae bacterium]
MDTAACAGCHLQMDAIGLAFEHYDARGAWREQDHGRAIDAHGEIVGGAGMLAGGFDGLGELQAKLADSEQVQDCLVQQWIRHVLGQGPNEVDPCVLAELQQRFAAADGDLRELVVLTTTSDAFRLRRLEAP